jgi:hypothetical protein
MAAASMNKQTTTPAPTPARNTNLTGVLFAYPSARERVFKQRKERQEEYERSQAKLAENGGTVSGDNGGTSAAVPTAEKRQGKTHGVKVQLCGSGGHCYDRVKNKPVVPVKEAPAPAVVAPAVAPVVRQTPPPPPSVDDIVQFPSLK